MGIHQINAPADGVQSVPVTASGFAGSEADALEVALADMIATFSGDFVNGRIGARRNTYGHRSRILRQTTEKLVTMRAPDAGGGFLNPRSEAREGRIATPDGVSKWRAVGSHSRPQK